MGRGACAASVAQQRRDQQQHRVTAAQFVAAGTGLLFQGVCSLTLCCLMLSVALLQGAMQHLAAVLALVVLACTAQAQNYKTGEWIAGRAT
jgi:hypothetical protein